MSRPTASVLTAYSWGVSTSKIFERKSRFFEKLSIFLSAAADHSLTGLVPLVFCELSRIQIRILTIYYSSSFLKVILMYLSPSTNRQVVRLVLVQFLDKYMMYKCYHSSSECFAGFMP